MPLTGALYGTNPPTTGLYGTAIYGLAQVLQTFVIPFEAQGYRVGPGFDAMFYETIDRGPASLQVVGV